MNSKVSWIVVMAVALWSCGGGEAGGGDSDRAMPGSEEATAAANNVASADQQGKYTRDSFVLCPALEDHREELASIVGFEQDPERGLSGPGSECIVHGEYSFARVTLLPAFTRSIAMHAQGFDAEASAAPELGADALFIDGALQPHVVFSMGELFIDVDAENIEKPSRQTMIELATRVREILREANS
jgi:hypothetical protein